MQFFLVDVVCISSVKPRETFDEICLEQLADAILQSEGLLRPLILKATQPEHFEVLDGHFQYWAAVRAHEKDPRKAEMVNAFVVSPKEQELAFKQLVILQDITNPTVPFAEKAHKTMVLSPQAISQEISRVFSPLQNEVRNIRGEMAAIHALPDQLQTMMHEMENRLQTFLMTRIEQSTPSIPAIPAKSLSTFSLDTLPEPLTGEDLAVLSWDQIKTIAKAKGIKIKGGRSNIEKQLLGNNL
jgi:hypothetical protein